MFSRTRRRRFVALAVAAFLIVPATVFASDGFIDVPDTQIFHGDIAWMDANGITSGCGGGNYCPDDNVTRGQMAAFMKRLATKKVVNAATAVTADTATTALTADTATTALTADTATTALTADNGARAYAVYRPGAIIVNGFTGLTSPSTGVFCFALDPALGISMQNLAAQVTPEWGTSFGSDLLAYWRQGAFACPGNTVEVQTYQFTFSSGNVTGVAPSNSVGFLLTVWDTGGWSPISMTTSSVTGVLSNNP